MERNDLITGGVQPGGRPPADGRLRLVQDFVNTLDRENGVELFDAPRGLDDWLAHRGLGAGRADAASLARAVELREALRTTLLANNHGADDAAARATLGEAAARAALRAEFGHDGPRLVPAADGVDAALGQVVAVAFEAMVDGSWERLKACPRDVCGWAFYDRSRNNGARWCSMQVCGSRVKAGTYYRRRTGR